MAKRLGETTDIGEIRQTFEWGTCGKFHDQPLRIILLKDISDSHLLHIIPFIKETFMHYTSDIYRIMILEQEYRMKNYIFVKDYD